MLIWLYKANTFRAFAGGIKMHLSALAGFIKGVACNVGWSST